MDEAPALQRAARPYLGPTRALLGLLGFPLNHRPSPSRATFASLCWVFICGGFGGTYAALRAYGLREHDMTVGLLFPAFPACRTALARSQEQMDGTPALCGRRCCHEPLSPDVRKGPPGAPTRRQDPRLPEAGTLWGPSPGACGQPAGQTYPCPHLALPGVRFVLV